MIVFSVISSETVRSGDFAPPTLLRATVGFGIRDVAFYGQYAICTTEAGMAVFKMPSGDSAEFVTEITLGIPLSINLGGHFRPKFIGSLAYIPNWDDGLWVIDLADPETPEVVTRVPTPGRLRTIAISGTYAYGTSTTPDTGLMTFDISNPRSPTVIRADSTLMTGVDLVLANGHAYVAGFTVFTFSLADPAAPVCTYINRESARAQAVRVQNGILYLTDVVDLEGSGLGGLATFSLANPDTPVLLGTEPVHHDNDADLFVWQSNAYIAGIKSLHLVDVADPATPLALTDYNTDSCDIETCKEAQGITVRGDYAYLVVPTDGIFVYRIRNRGDCNADSLTSTVDIIRLAGFLFRSGPPPLLPDQGDLNCDGVTTSEDLIKLVYHVFKGAPPPFCP